MAFHCLPIRAKGRRGRSWRHRAGSVQRGWPWSKRAQACQAIVPAWFSAMRVRFTPENRRRTVCHLDLRVLRSTALSVLRAFG